MSGRSLDWPGGSATMHGLGAMVAPIRLTLPDGRIVEPMHRAPWLGSTLPEDTPGILRGMQGDFVCVPFGTGDPSPLPSRWRAAGIEAPAVEPPHGLGANAEWEIAEIGGGLRAEIAYGADDPVARLVRTLMPAGPDHVEMALTIEVRRDVRLPVALHPVFRLPETPGAARLSVEHAGPVWTHPCGSGPDPCPLVPDAVAAGLAVLPGREGVVDLTALPLPFRAESRVLVVGAAGRAELAHRAEGWAVALDWDAGVLPNLMLWVSNRGRAGAPWDGRHLALGMEPCAAAFDLGVAASVAASPLSAAGVRTAVALRAGEPLTIRWGISVRGVEGD